MKKAERIAYLWCDLINLFFAVCKILCLTCKCELRLCWAGLNYSYKKSKKWKKGFSLILERTSFVFPCSSQGIDRDPLYKKSLMCLKALIPPYSLLKNQQKITIQKLYYRIIDKKKLEKTKWNLIKNVTRFIRSNRKLSKRLSWFLFKT